MYCGSTNFGSSGERAVLNRLTNNLIFMMKIVLKAFGSDFLKSFGLSKRKSQYLIGLSNYMSANNSFKFWKGLGDEEVFSN